MFELVRMMFTDARMFIAAVVLGSFILPFVVLTFLLIRAMWRDLW